MVTLPITQDRSPWVIPNLPKPPKFLHFALPFFTVGERREFKFGGQPTDDKPSLKGAWSCHMTNVKFLVP